MEEMMMARRKQTCMPNSTSPSPAAALAVHKDSQTISKVKPKIRIIHIFAPEIIKTDVANFRELVQRLTGKPSTNNKKGSSCYKKKPRNITRRMEEEPRTTMCSDKMELCRERIVKEEEEEIMWRSSDNSGGFLGGFADLDGFMQELGEFPLFPLDAASSHMHLFGETHQPS